MKKFTQLEKTLVKHLRHLYRIRYRQISDNADELEDRYVNSNFSEDILAHDKEMKAIRKLLDKLP